MLPLLLSLAALAGPAWSDLKQDSGWTHSHDATKNGIAVSVYHRTLGGVDCYQGRATVPGKASTLLGVATDVEGTTRWSSAGLSDAELLGRSGNRIDYYQHLPVPVPLVSDRFWFLRGYVEQTGDTAAFYWDRLANGGGYAQYQTVKAAHPDAVEPPINVGGWLFQQQGANVMIRYSVCADPGGSIPDSVQMIGTKRTLPDAVADLVKEGQRRGG